MSHCSAQFPQRSLISIAFPVPDLRESTEIVAGQHFVSLNLRERDKIQKKD